MKEGEGRKGGREQGEGETHVGRDTDRERGGRGIP